MTPDLQALLTKLEGLRAKATAGEWRVMESADCYKALVVGPDTIGYISATESDDDARLIAALVNSWPTLLSALKGREVPESLDWPQQPTDDMLRAAHAALFVDVRFGTVRNGIKAAYHAMRREHERRLRAMLFANPADEGGKG